jgi:hypothetical protein
MPLANATEGDKPAHVYCCPEEGCGRRFSRKYTMIEHTKTHTGEKPHVCPVRACGKRFSTSGNLSRHKRLHATIDPLPCPAPGCLSTFESANKLEKHMKFHRGDAVHVCAINNCGKTFSTTGNLNRHIKNHHQRQSTRAMSDSDGDASMDQEDPHESFAELMTANTIKGGDICVTDAHAGPTSVEYVGFYGSAGTWSHEQMAVDALADIFRDHVAVPGDADVDAGTSKVSSILDDVISFHVTHLSPLS